MMNRLRVLLLILLALPGFAAEPPSLEDAGVEQLAAALTHTNLQTRRAATRLLLERNDAGTEEALRPLTSSMSFRGLDESKARALWILHRLRKLSPELLAEAIGTDGKPLLQINALRIAAEQRLPGSSREDVFTEQDDVLKEFDAGLRLDEVPSAEGAFPAEIHAAILKRVRGLNPRVRYAAFRALAASPVTAETREVVLDLWPNLTEPALESAALAVASKDPAEFIEAAASTSSPLPFSDLVSPLAARLDAPAAAGIVVHLSVRPESADTLKRAVLDALVKKQESSPAPAIPPWSDELTAAFKAFFAGPSFVSAAALPLAASWDKSGKLKEEVQKLIPELLEKLKDDLRSDDQRGQYLASLLAVRRLDTNILPAVSRLLGGTDAPGFQRKVIDTLGSGKDADAGRMLSFALTNLPSSLRDAAFARIRRRADWSLALLDAIQSGDIQLASLAPTFVRRLESHSDSAVASRAAEVLAALRPEEKGRNDLLKKFAAVATEPGNAKAGKKLFTQNCAGCHRFKDDGKDLAPNLTDLGTLGAKDLLVDILDPDRVVEPEFATVTLETKDELAYTGIVTRESKSAVTLRDASGENDIKPDDIRFRAANHRSLMPSGFEVLGAEGLRDLLAFLCADQARFRLLDLNPVFTANSARGIFEGDEESNETMAFRKTGVVKAGEVPFEIANPARTPGGNNLVVLRGGKGTELPAKVELKDLKVSATTLHFLGGVGVGAWPCCDESKNAGLPVARVTVFHEDGEKEEFTLANGVVFVDYSDATADVSGSKRVPGLVTGGQVRSFTRTLKATALIERIVLESFDNSIAPIFVAITAELPAKKEKPKQDTRKEPEESPANRERGA